MKKRNLKNLVLNKTSVSNLNGGGETLDTGTFTGPTDTAPNSNFIGCWSDGVNSCPTEAPTCGQESVLFETCGIECESIQNPF
ncbi:hypothetical protein H2O64_01340 [Kordia sp. YSTF-M3]|uniref:Bacteriocin n=1 Tax=Kordia aestuariivivens TaxID=2759037 RepID=A0ABR7Q3Z9_9FLAO|nr:hypothetical protein [Kordia aestuariivivens]MBC8753294.1 hypothetical protein [Kordia aestuariivivens]